MNEEDILFLIENGYRVDDIGAITNSEGTYMSEVSLGGRTIESFASIEDFNHHNEKERQVNASGYEYDELSEYNERDQKEQSLAKVKLNEYMSDPDYSTLIDLPKKGAEDYNFQAAFDDIQEERRQNGDPYFDSLEALQENVETTKQEAKERDVLLSQMETEEEREEYVRNELDLKLFEKENGIDDVESYKRFKDQDMIAVVGGTVMANPGEDANIIEKGAWKYNKFMSDSMAWLAGGLSDEGEGLEEEELKEEYIGLKDKQFNMVAPIAQRQKDAIDKRIEDIELQVSSDDIDYSGYDYKMLVRQHQQLGKKSMQLDDYVNRRWFDTSIFSTKTIVDLTSFGFVDVYEQATIDLSISKKQQNKEELTDLENQYLETQYILQESENPLFEQSFWHEATGGTIHSLGFLAGGWGGRIVGKGVSRLITGKLSKLATPLVRTLAVSGNLATQTALHSGTYNSSMDKYVGELEMVEGKNGQPIFLARQDLYNSLKEENSLMLEEIDIALTKNSGDPKAVAELQAARKNLIAYDNSIKAPFSGIKSLLYGGFETLKEVTSEQLGGVLLGKIGVGGRRGLAWAGKKTKINWADTKLGKGIINSRKIKRFKDLGNRLADKTNYNLDDFNRLTSTVPGAKLIGGQGEEMFEEILVQVVPTVGSSWEDYTDQLTELTSADFYMKVAAQTFLMRSGTKAFSKASSRYNMYRGLSSEDKATAKKARAELQITLTDLAKRGATQQEFNAAFMNIGEGKFSIADYNNAIKGLEAEGNFQDLATQEELRRAFAQKQIQSVQASGKLKEFKKALLRAKYNKNLDVGTQGHVSFLLKEAQAIEGDDATYVNSTQVIDLKAKKRYTDNAIKKLNLAKLSGEVNESEALDEINKKLGSEGKTIEEIFKGDLKFALGNIGTMSKNAQAFLAIEQQSYAMTESSEKLQKEIDRVTDFKHQNVLMNEQDYKTYLAKVEDKGFKGKMTAANFKKYVADQPRKDFKRKLGVEKLTEINDKIYNQLILKETQARQFSHLKKLLKEQEALLAEQEAMAAKAEEANTDPEVSTRRTDEKVVVEEEITNEEAPVNTEATPKVKSTSVETPVGKTDEQTEEYHTAVQDNIYSALETVAETTSNLEDEVQEEVEKSATQVETSDTQTTEEQQSIVDQEALQKALDDDLELFPMGSLLNEETTAALKGYYADKLKWEGVAPTFKDFWIELIAGGFIKKNDLNKNQMKMFGLNWEAAKNGTSSWESLWEKQYVKPNSFLSGLFSENNTEVSDDTEVVEQEKEGSAISITQAEPNQGINPKTGEVKAITPVEGKTAVVETKANFKSLEYKNVVSEVVTVYGKKVIQVTKEDASEEVPTLVESETINVKAALRSNPGDTWSVEIASETQWNIPVEVINPKTWKSTFMPFSEWVKKNKPNEMSLGEFKNTPEFINKVPMLYRNAAGEVTSVVADSDWHNPLRVKDTSKKAGEFVELDNPSVQHKATIKEGRDNTISLRNKIASGEVTSVQVDTRNGSPWTRLPSNLPSMPLSQMNPTSQVVFYKGGTFYNLENERITEESSKKVILNPELPKKLNTNGKATGNNSAYYLSTVYTENGIEYVEAIPVLRKNENNEYKAFEKDIQTAKHIFGAQRVLKYPDADQKMLGITMEEAVSLQKLIKAQLGVDIQDYEVSKELVHGLIAMQGKDANGKFQKFTASAIDIPIREVKNGKGEIKEVTFATALFKGQGGTIIQNTYLSKNATGITIIKDAEGNFKVEVAPTYEDFLKTRLSTGVMSYSIGTEGNPQYTHSVQPIITLKTTVAPAVSPQVTKKAQPKVAIEKKTMSKEQSQEIIDAQNLLRELNALNEDSIAEDYLGNLDNITNVKKALELVTTFAPKQQKELGQFMFSLIIKNHLEAGKLNNLEFKELVINEYKAHFEDKKNKVLNSYYAIKQIAESEQSNEGVQVLLKNLVDTVENLDMIINNVDDIYLKKVREAGKKQFISSNIKSVKDLEEQLNKEAEAEAEGYTKDYNKSSNEVVHKDKISKKLKRIFSEVSTGETGFMGVEVYENYDKVYNQIASFLSNPLPLAPTFDAMIGKLETIKEFSNIVEALKEADQQVQNGFVSNMYKYAANARFIAFTSDNEIGLEGEVWFSNRNNLPQKIKESWENNFKRSSIVDGDLINKEVLQDLADQYDSWGEEAWKQDPTVLRTWLEDFGIVLSDGSWDEIMAGNLSINRTGLTNEVQSFEELFFDEGKRHDKLFSNLANYAKNNAKSKNELNYTKNEELVPFDDMNNIIKGLIEIESHHNASLANITRRDGGKSVSEIVFPSFFLDSFNKLSKSANGNKEDIKALQELAYSENSYWLDLMMSEAAMGDIFSYAETGLMSMRNVDKPVNDFSKIEDLSPLDYIYHQRAMFQYMQTEKFPRYKGFNMRVATVSIPTSSDKGRMMLLKVPVFDLLGMENTLIPNDEGGIDFSTELENLLYDQLVKPELNRIVKSTQDVDIKNYNKGAVRFNAMPGLNLLQPGDISAIKFLEEGGTVEEFEEQFKQVAVQHIKDLITADVNENLKAIGDIESKKDLFNKSDYVNRGSGTVQQNKKSAEFDYIINSYFSNSNIMQTIAGDPALYFNTKGSDSTTENVEDQLQYSKDLGVNMGKRLALMLAPGIVGANSSNQQHIQLFLKDQKEVAVNAEKIVGYHYGNSVLKEKYKGKTYAAHIQDLRTGNISAAIKNHLNLKFAKVADFFSIETTDAQEYTTLKEHLRMLVGDGKINQEKADIIYDTVLVKKLPLDKNDPDVQIVLQPMKPVYTGSKIEKDENGKSLVNRIVYIKSSSFPLIPDLVAGTPLEALMDKMNEIEERSGKTVRASYQSANKVGAMNNPIDPFNQEQLDELTTNYNEETHSPNNSLVLDSQSLKIQQDVPFKSDVIGDDKVSMGTQIFKLLFGDGVSDINIEGFNGKELQEEFFQTFSTMINISKADLLDRLGLEDRVVNGKYVAFDEKESAEKLSDLLKETAEERDFSENDIKILGLDETRGIDHFKLPLWFSGNSNKFESMLNAIINNKIFKQKLPGNAFVVGSEAGMTLKVQGEVDVKNQTIFIGDYRGGELQGTEVLAPSKIKVRGKLIDLFEQDKGGNYKYIKEIEGGGFEINEDKLDPSLVENFTFRTPTSSHGSGSSIKIVGFIPSVMGDLMITPKNFITQMGQDFDVDKLTSYQYHHGTNSEGKITRLDESFREQALSKLKQDLKKLEQQGAIAGNAGLGMAMFDRLLLEGGLGSVEAGLLTEEEFVEILMMEDADMDAKIKKAENKFDMKIAQNKFIEIHNIVYTNQSPEIQKKINKVLSMEVAEKQAEGIDQINDTDKRINILSPNYQMEKLISGSTGTTAIAVYAKGVTFNSLAQQAESPLGLITVNSDGVVVPKSIRIGNITSDGVFGKSKAISKKGATAMEIALARAITEIMDERVNTATDNEKAQILGRVGITHLDSVAVDNLLALLGVDLEINTIEELDYDSGNSFHKKAIVDGKPVFYEQYSIPYLLHSQPIIQEYFKELKNARSITSDSTPNVEEAIFLKLTAGHKFTNKSKTQAQSQMTGAGLVANLSTSWNTDAQKEILGLYVDLISDAKAVKELNQIVDLSNLGRSMWELKEKIDTLEKLKDPNGEFAEKFNNPLALLGKYDDEGNFVPTTNQGVMVNTALEMGRNLFFDYYPYYDSYIEEKINKIVANSNFSGSPVALKETIFQEIKKYITTNPQDGIFTATPTQTREAIFFNKDGNQSLSRYMADLKTTNPIIKENMLLNALSFTVGVNGKPDLIKFDNTEGANITEEDFHLAFKELLVEDIPLPTRNGEAYSTRKMAQELIAYSHSSGGIVSEVIEFHKYIPIEYYQDLRAKGKSKTGKVRNTRSLNMLQRYDTKLNSWGNAGVLENFEVQFFQNNPRYAPILEANRVFTSKGDRLYLKKENHEDLDNYITLRNPGKSLKTDKWSLYKLLDDSGTYQKLEVVGDFGLAEYDYTKPLASTGVESQKVKPTVVPLVIEPMIVANPVGKAEDFTIGENDSVMDVLEKISNTSFVENGNLAELAAAMSNLFKDKALSTKIVIINDINVPIGGAYKANTITVNLAMSNPAEIFVHEFVHSVTADYINQYISKEGVLSPNAPTDIKEINQVFSDYQKQIAEKYPAENAEFIRKWAVFTANKALLPADRTPVSFSPRETSVFYTALNLKEFLAITLSNNVEFLKETSKMKYKTTNISIATKFKKVFQRILNTIAGTNNTVGKDLIESSLSFVSSRADAMSTPIPQNISNSEMERLKALYGEEFTGEYLPNGKQKTISQVIEESTAEIATILKDSGATINGNIATFDKGTNLEIYSAYILASHRIEKWNRNNYNVDYAKLWYQTNKQDNIYQMKFSFPEKLQNDLIEDKAVLPDMPLDDVDYYPGDTTYDFKRLEEDKIALKKNIDQRLSVLKEVHNKTLVQKEQIDRLKNISITLKYDIDDLRADENGILEIFEVFTRDLKTIENEFLKNPIIENLLLGRDYLDKMRNVVSQGEGQPNRFSKEYFEDIKDKDIRELFQALQTKYNSINAKFDAAEIKFVEDNIDSEGAPQVEASIKKTNIITKKLSQVTSGLEHLFMPIDGAVSSTPMQKYLRKTHDDIMAKRESTVMARTLKNMQKEVEAELKRLNLTNDSKFLLEGISDVKFSIFFREDSNGNNRLISRYSNEWGELKENLNKALFDIESKERDFNIKNKKRRHFNIKNEKRRHVFKTLEDNNVEYIDVRKLPELIGDTNFKEFGKNFVDIDTANKYKEQLILQIMEGSTNRKAAEKVYEDIVLEQMNNLIDFQFEVESKFEKLKKKEGVNTFQELLPKSQELFRQFVFTNSPFKFMESYEKNNNSEIELTYTNTDGKIVKTTNPSSLRYTSIIPTTSNFKSKTFNNTIENNPILYKAWEAFSESISYINRNRKYQQDTEEFERDADGNIIKAYKSDQSYDDSLSHEYERIAKNFLGIAGLNKYLLSSTLEKIKQVFSTSNFRDTTGNMKIKGEIKSIDEVVKREMKDMEAVLRSYGLLSTATIDMNKVPTKVIEYLEERNGGELATNGTYGNLLRKIAEKQVLKTQKVNLFDSLAAQLNIVETFKNKKEVEMQLLFVQNMFRKLKKGENNTNATKQIDSYISYHLYGINNRANWVGLKQDKGGYKITSLQSKELLESNKLSITLIDEAIAGIEKENITDEQKRVKQIELEKLKKELEDFASSGGRVITTGSVFEAIFMKAGILVGLGFNLKSQVHNYLIGNLAGMANDSLEWTEGNFEVARSYARRWKAMAGAAHLTSLKDRENYLLTETLLNDLGIFQNSANEIDNIREEQWLKKGNRLFTQPLRLVGEMEKIIQRPQILAMLGDVRIYEYDSNGEKVIDNNGDFVSVPAFNIADTSNPHPAFELIKGELTLKSKYAVTDKKGNNKNTDTWINKISQDADFKNDTAGVDSKGKEIPQSYASLFGNSGKLPKTIARINGDYRETSTVGAKTQTGTALLMMFKTWVPAYIMRRYHPEYGVINGLASTGRGVEGATAQTSSQFFNALGNVVLLGGNTFMGAALGIAYFGNQYIRSIKQDVDKSKGIVKKITALVVAERMIRTLAAGGIKTVQMTSSTLFGKRMISNETINSYAGIKQNEGESDAQFKDNLDNLHFLLTELGASIQTMAMKGMAQVFYHLLTDDDDEENKIALGLHFAIENLLARYMGEINLANSPMALGEMVVKGNADSSYDKVLKLLDYVDDQIEGKGTFKSGRNKGENKVIEGLQNLWIPRGLTSYGGFESSITEDFEPNDQFNQLQYSDKKRIEKNKKKMVANSKVEFEASIREQFPLFSDKLVKEEVAKMVKDRYDPVSEADFNSKGQIKYRDLRDKYAKYLKD
jgi:hypothetical protein